MDSASDRLHIGNIWISHSGMNLYDNTARLHAPILMHYGAPDPLYHKFPDNSPWSHCSGDPLNKVDPTGMDIYNFDNNGNLISIDLDEENDFIAILDNDNQYIYSIQFPYGTIEHHKQYNNGAGGHFDILQVNGDEAGKAFFEFFSENTGIEYSLFTTGINGKGPNFISTSHENDQEAAGTFLFNNQLRYGYHINSHYHNHPEGYYPSTADFEFSYKINKYLKRIINFYVYRKPKEKKSETYEHTPY